MNQVLDEERVERACAEFFGDALWEKFGQTAKSRGRRNIGAAISAYLGETSCWQPIETAPKDGTHILALDPEGRHGHVQAVVHWYVHKGETFKESGIEGLYRKEPYEVDWWEGAGYTPFRATHWQPLPSPPFNVNTGSDSVKTAQGNHSPSTLNAETE